MAMEARGYKGGEGRTKLRELQISKVRYLFVCVIFSSDCGAYSNKDLIGRRPR